MASRGNGGNGQRVLVTGAAGYIGSILCEHLLDAGYHVTALDTLVFGGGSLFHLCANPRFDFQLGDARDDRVLRELVPRADVLIPLAAVVGAPACDRDPLVARTLNLEAVRRLLALRSAQQLVVYPTTNSGYGTSTGAVFCTEETPLEPISLYGETKVQAEQAVLDSRNAITLRLATVFGMSPRMRLDLLVNHFVYAAVTDGYLVIFEKDFKRNYVHIRDVADCFLHCIAHAEAMTGRPYNLGLDSANLSKEELALKVKEQVPRFYIHFSEVGSDPDKRNYIVSNERLRQAGFEARRSLEEGIRELLKGYRMLGRGQHRNV
jgi:nucleoside-diphosphate-sugar epimerase